MTSGKTNILVQNSPLQGVRHVPTGDYVDLAGETYYRISQVDQMPTFFMTLVSAYDHWLFIASNGGLTAGRTNLDSALFPYETEDKIAAHHAQTGSKTLLRVARGNQTALWEPFSDYYAGLYRCERHIYKNIPGNKLIFEEINYDLELTLRIAWRTGDRFGFIRTCWLINNRAEGGACQVEILDGLQNLLPAGATATLQTRLSNLLNAYKRSELDEASGLGVFSLSATLTDRAEPSESLRATVAWQVGLEAACYLLSKEQLDGWRYGRSLTPEQDVCGKVGAYFVNAAFDLAPGETKQWYIVADVNQESAGVTQLIHFLKQDSAEIKQQIETDIAQATAELVSYVAAADGLQLSAQRTTTAHHFANVLFNIMRGGIFKAGYMVDRHDLIDFLQVRNRVVLEHHADWFAALPATLTIRDLFGRAAATGVPDLIRLCYEYLPLSFSRRHGDPSRPWNYFSINLKQPDGSPRLDYQGNWRDIFQNWEPLALVFPDYIEGMIAKFLNATTADGYNPYRITRNGIEWEVPEPDNPWSNIGYWNDHQIIYLQKLLEIAEQVHPGKLAQLWNRAIFAYANVPYRLRPYPQMLADWYNTIDFDWASESEIETAVTQIGTDARLLRDNQGTVIHVTMFEKLLSLLLAKLANLVPEGGIWMNTQRPEWNDANNALVGKGVSVITTAYLRRFILFWRDLLESSETTEFLVNKTLAALFEQIQAVLITFQPNLETGFSDERRQAMMDVLGAAITTYRSAIYHDGVPEEQTQLNHQVLSNFLALAQDYIEQTLRVNRRPDGLYHSYNILHLHTQGVGLERLYLMLEGQVAILSTGLLSPEAACTLLESMRHSDLYRADQHTYLLYPYRRLPNFRQKNNVTAAQVTNLQLVAALTVANDSRLLLRDVAGVYHFNGRFRNAADVAQALNELAQEPVYTHLVESERDVILNLFETTFDHHAFTGRSGTFFAYEGLGSIYWHMVAKLLLAVQEVYQQAVVKGAEPSVINTLATAYHDIRSGMGFNKTPDVYGAFPTDPYSHTPMGSGARQPGMTGVVKEEILTRWGELGVTLLQGSLCFKPTLLNADEFLQSESNFDYVNVSGETQTLRLPPNSLAFTICQVPVVYQHQGDAKITVVDKNGRITTWQDDCLDFETTQHIFNRDGQVKQIWLNMAFKVNSRPAKGQL